MSDDSKYSELLKEIGELILQKNNYISMKDFQVEKLKKAFEEANEASHNEINCMNKYFDWQNEMFKKYGKDGKLKLGDIPNDEVLKGSVLKGKWDKARLLAESLEKKEDSFYKETK